MTSATTHYRDALAALILAKMEGRPQTPAAIAAATAEAVAELAPPPAFVSEFRDVGDGRIEATFGVEGWPLVAD